ncbi:hypothetical protein [Streptomyces lunaelactis]|uniref:hypothetical protein n=1 Tax=Streptomyces lunaelactis TaxID=1535768 RepID=UPI001585C36E|nr:hypothetical protein [Streptomyces lunaelactis]NUL27036.1 hypothetical protein [Streptomyces lunaelactis]
MRAIARRRIILVLDVPVGPHGGHAGSREPRPAPDRLPLPAGTYIDDNAAVSYWQSDMSDALTF